MEKTLPMNLDAEQGVLGSIILDPGALPLIADRLAPEDFYREAHRAIYGAALGLYRKGEPPDFITLCDALGERLEDAGGAHYVTSLINIVPTSGNIEYYAALVSRDAVRRRLIQAAGQIAASAYESPDADESLLAAETRLFDIRKHRHERGGATMQEAVGRYRVRMDELLDRKERGLPSGVPTGFSHLDKLTGGFQRSDLITIAARPGVGKTSFSLNVARYITYKAAAQGWKTRFFSLEMSEEQVVQRLVSMETGIDQTRLRTADISEAERDALVPAFDRLEAGWLWIDDTPGLTVLDIRSRAKRQQAEGGLDFIIVDYMQIVKPMDKAENRVQQVSQIARDLKGLARELKVPVLALAQLSREAEKHQVPLLSDLKEAGAIEEESDIVAFIHHDEFQEQRKKKNLPYQVNVILAKHRNGPLGSVELRFEPTLTAFHQVAGEITR